jgi:uncharacterized protein
MDIPVPSEQPVGSTGPGLREPVHHVSRRAIGYWTTRAILDAVVVLGVGVGIAAASGFRGWWWPVLGVAALLFLARILIMPRWRYRVHRWEVTDQALYTRSGWISIRWRIAPISRIQTVDSHRSFWERVFGLANVTATTASAAGHIRIHGLDKAVAERLQSDLTITTAQTPGDAT